LIAFPTLLIVLPLVRKFTFLWVRLPNEGAGK